jgi:hypothetical protein
MTGVPRRVRAGASEAPGTRRSRIPLVPPRGAAELAEVTVLPIDRDYDLLAAVTGQPVERLTQP